MSWVSAIPDVLACVGLFFAPGLLATYLGGLRGITAWAMAPLMTVAAVSVIAVLGGVFGFRFGWWPAAIGFAFMAVLSAGLSVLLRARHIEQAARDPRSYSLAVAIGAVAAVVIGAVTFITGVKRPDAISESYDAVYHYNAVRYIEQTGKASPLTIGTLGQPASHGAFYPDAWHAMAALLAGLTGASVPVAATVTCLVIAVLVWPLSCLLLARHLFGTSGSRAAVAVVITGMLSSLFGAYPWMMTGWGMLWPNALGMAMAPAGVALGMAVIRVSDGDSFGAVRRWLFGAAGAWAIAIAHPNSALSVALICAFPLLVVLGPYLYDQWNRHTLRTTLALLAIIAAGVAGFAIASTIGQVHNTLAHYFPLTDTPGRAMLGAFSNGTDFMRPEWLLTGLMVIGAIACLVWRQRRWLVVAELVIAGLYVAAAGIGSHVTKLFTGLWYNDTHRIAAILPIVAIPLATTGVLAVGALLNSAVARVTDAASPASFAVGLPLAVGAVIALATAFYSGPRNSATVGSMFSTSGYEVWVSPAKLGFLKTVARLVPANAVVADDPFAGSAYLYALSGTRVLFPQAAVASNNQDTAYLAHNLVNLQHDPLACELVRRFGVGYMIVAPDNYLSSSQQPGYYGTGVADPAPGSGFRLMAASGSLKLYKITICQPPNQPGASIEAASHGS